jgi:hypothetical protein
LVWLLVAIQPFAAHAFSYKCRSADRSVSYQQLPCSWGEIESRVVPGPAVAKRWRSKNPRQPRRDKLHRQCLEWAESAIDPNDVLARTMQCQEFIQYLAK